MLSLLVIGFLALGAAQAGVTGDCPYRSFMYGVSVPTYMGTWYQLASMGVYIDKLATRCDQAEYTLNTTSGTVDVVNSAILKIGGRKITWEATGVLQADGSFQIQPKTGGVTAPYYILDTDYENFALVTSCLQTKIGPAKFHLESGWILTRRRYPNMEMLPVDVNKRINQLLAENGIDRNLFLVSDNTYCPVDE